MTPIQKLIQKQLTPINNQTFSSYEDLENAVFPLYGPLQIHFLGEGYRDLIDRLIRGGWIKDDKTGKYTVQIPEDKTEEKVETVAPVVNPLNWDCDSNSAPVTPAPRLDTLPPWLPSLSFREIFWLVKLNNGYIRDNEWQKHDLASLIEKGLVEYVDVREPLPQNVQEAIEASATQRKSQAVTAIMQDQFFAAMDILSDLADEFGFASMPDMVYRLTEKGQQYMALQHDAVEPTA